MWTLTPHQQHAFGGLALVPILRIRDRPILSEYVAAIQIAQALARFAVVVAGLHILPPQGGTVSSETGPKRNRRWRAVFRGFASAGQAYFELLASTDITKIADDLIAAERVSRLRSFER